jgi:hypothetical protein
LILAGKAGSMLHARSIGNPRGHVRPGASPHNKRGLTMQDYAVPQPSRSQAKIRDKIVAAVQSARNNILSLDLSDSDAMSFLVDRLGGHDRLKHHFPQSLATLEATRCAHEAAGGPQRVTLLEQDELPIDQWYPYVNLTYFSIDPDGVTMVGQGVVTLPGTATSVDINLTIVDSTTGQTIADVTLPTQFNVSTQQINAKGQIADPKNVDAVATLTASFVPAGSNVAVPVVVTAKFAGANVVQSVSVVNPNHNNHPNNTYIKVALNRTQAQQPDCDYWYQYGTDGAKPVVGLQVNGSAQLVSGFSVGSPPNFAGNCVLMRRSGVGDGATLAFPSDQIPGLCTGAGATVTWNIGPDWFKGAPWDQNQTIDLDFMLSFAVTPGGGSFIRVTSLPAVVSNDPPSNVAPVVPMMFVWGCLAAGSMVLMADGGEKRIEAIGIGERVRGPDGAALIVRNCWTGRETQPLVRLGTDDGASLLVTEEHPMLVPDGVRLARDLAVGDLILTAAGQSPLSLAERASFDGNVHNLDLAPEGLGEADMPETLVTAFVAGGFAVGDNRMQGIHSARAAEEARALDPLDLLGPEWRLDIVNARRAAAELPLLEAHRIAAE